MSDARPPCSRAIKGKPTRAVASKVEPLSSSGPLGLHLKHRDGAACCDPFQLNPAALTSDTKAITCDLCSRVGEHARSYYNLQRS